MILTEDKAGLEVLAVVVVVVMVLVVLLLTVEQGRHTGMNKLKATLRESIGSPRIWLTCRLNDKA